MHSNALPGGAAGRGGYGGFMTSIVFAPGDLIIATSDGIDVRFAGINLGVRVPHHALNLEGTRGVQVKLEGVRGFQTQQRDQQHESAILAWAERLKAHGRGNAGPAPTMPAVPVLDRVRSLVTDDVGTDYKLAAGQVAGSGTDWDASWIYSPEPPDAARILTLRFTLDGSPTGKECKVSLA